MAPRFPLFGLRFFNGAIFVASMIKMKFPNPTTQLRTEQTMAQIASTVTEQIQTIPTKSSPLIITSNQLIDDTEIKLSEAASEINKYHIQIEGWLYKKSRVLKKWRKRWMVLAGDVVYSYKTQKNYSEDPTEQIDIKNILKIEKHEACTSNQYSFDIELEKKLIFTLAADSLTYRDLWLSELNKLIHLNRSMMITKSSGPNSKILSFGCKHFRRNCSYLCSCCSRWYFCSYCHDSEMSGFINGGHELERKCIVAMKCMNCGKEQPPSVQCIRCNIAMSTYFCAVCKFWDNDGSHQLFHCDKCGVCRAGKREDYIHCDKCMLRTCFVSVVMLMILSFLCRRSLFG